MTVSVTPSALGGQQMLSLVAITVTEGPSLSSHPFPNPFCYHDTIHSEQRQGLESLLGPRDRPLSTYRVPQVGTPSRVLPPSGSATLSVTVDRHSSLENSEPRSARTWGNTGTGGSHLLPGEPLHGPLCVISPWVQCLPDAPAPGSPRPHLLPRPRPRPPDAPPP